MTIANVSLLDSYALWLTRFNQSITYLNTFDGNNVTLVSNTPALTIAGSGYLGSNVYLNIGVLSTSLSDQSTTNIASANVTYTLGIKNSLVFDQANSAYVKANSAYDHGNAAYSQANTAYSHVSDAYGVANSAAGAAGSAFNQANLVFGHANAAFAKANGAFANTSGATFAGDITLPGNVTISGSGVVLNLL